MYRNKKNQSGFSVIESLLIIAIVSLVGCVGWYVWHKDNPESASHHVTQSQQTSKTASYIFGPSDVVYPYVLPRGWTSLDCGDGSLDIFVPGEKAPGNCKINSDSNPKYSDSAYMGNYFINTSYIDTQSCAHTLDIRENSGSEYPASEYSCQDVQIGGKKGLRQLGTHTTMSFVVQGVPSVKVFYDFPAGKGEMFEASYTHYTESSYPDLTKDFDNFVNSLKFK